jgi:hypothetical protein
MKLFKNAVSTVKLAYLSGGLALAYCIVNIGCTHSVSKPTPVAQKTIYFGKDTLFLNVLHSDTIRADSLSFGSDKSSSITFTLADSANGMSLHDSIFSWTPVDTGAAHVAILVCSGNNLCDTIRGSFHAVYGPIPIKRIHFSKDTLIWIKPFSDTLHAESFGVSFSSSVHSFRFIDSSRGMKLTDSVFSWTPNTIGHIPLSILGCGANNSCVTLVDTFYVLPNDTIPVGCPPYTRKDNIQGHQWHLPSGFFVFAYDWASQINGLFISKINKFQPSIIPNTRSDFPRSIGISKNGNWILYINDSKPYLITRDGNKKVPVPTKNSVDMAVFYRSSPYGEEICYTGTIVSQPVIHSVQVTLDSTPVFGNDRIIADLTGKFRIERYYNFGVSRDGILGAFTLLYQDTIRLRMGFLTIPDGGRGIAGPDNMYKWKNDDNRQFWGCNATLSHDGSQALYIGGAAGFGLGYTNCLPPEHQGFVVTPFRRDNDPPIDIDEHIVKYALSLNWCPKEYRFGKWDEMDFRGWSFSNRNDYAIGCQAGTLSPIKALWMVDWQSNIWTMLTPPDSNISVDQGGAAVFFSDSFSMVDDGNPYYRVIYPNGGEVFKVGQQCTVKVASQRDGNAGVKISLQNGLYSFMLPSITHAINPYVDSTVIFSIPETFTLKRYSQALGGIEEIPISTISDSCRICVQDYNATNGFGDCSMGFFRIRAKE